MVDSEKSKVIVLASGGIDSTACLYYYLQKKFFTTGLFIDFGQATAKNELNSVNRIAQHYQVNIDVIKINMPKRFGAGEIRGRNAFFALSCLMNYPNFSGIICLGIHAGVPYYDTTETFINDMNRIFAQYTNGIVQIEAPFLDWEKSAVFKYCKDNNIPIDMTYSCEKGEFNPCGVCNSCLDRKAYGCLQDELK